MYINFIHTWGIDWPIKVIPSVIKVNPIAIHLMG